MARNRIDHIQKVFARVVELGFRYRETRKEYEESRRIARQSPGLAPTRSGLLARMERQVLFREALDEIRNELAHYRGYYYGDRLSEELRSIQSDVARLELMLADEVPRPLQLGVL